MRDEKSEELDIKKREDYQHEIDRLMQTFPPRLQRLMEMRADGWSYEQIAIKLNFKSRYQAKRYHSFVWSGMEFITKWWHKIWKIG